MAVIALTKKQVAELVNQATREYLGEDALLVEDLTNVVDIGVTLANANAYKNFLANLLVEIGKKIFVERPYAGFAPKVYRDSFEYGQVIEKIRASLDDAMDNQSWELVDGGSYDPNVYINNEVQAKLFMKEVTFEVRKSITDKQLKNAFKSANELGSFVSMLFNYVEHSLTIKMDSLIMMTIANFTAEVAHANNTVTYVNLLANYNKLKTLELTVDQCLTDRGFLQYATGIIKKYQSKMTSYSTLFNQTKTKTFTPLNLQHLVLLDEFSMNCDTYLASDTWHNEFVKLPYHETVPYWQGQGNDSTFANTSKINIKTSNNNTVEVTGILAVLFDHDALGVSQYRETVKTHYNEPAEFTNYWFKRETAYFNDLDENFVVFYVK